MYFAARAFAFATILVAARLIPPTPGYGQEAAARVLRSRLSPTYTGASDGGSLYLEDAESFDLAR